MVAAAAAPVTAQEAKAGALFGCSLPPVFLPACLPAGLVTAMLRCLYANIKHGSLNCLASVLYNRLWQ